MNKYKVIQKYFFFRILAVGWDQQVTEFNDIEGREYGDPKKWPTFHTDDITCADVNLGEGVVTATYSGELIFWKLETGQPYRRYSVSNPKKFIELKHNAAAIDNNKMRESERVSTITVSRYVRRSISETIREINKQMSSIGLTNGTISENASISSMETQLKPKNLLPTSVQAVLFLQTRPLTREHGKFFKSTN